MARSPSVDLGRFTSSERVALIEQRIDKRDALTRLADLAATSPQISDKIAFHRAIFEREEVANTAIGFGVAVPHARLPSIHSVILTIGICAAGIDYGAQDRAPVTIVVMLAAPDQERQLYLPVLAAVATRLKDQGLRAAMLAAKDRAGVLAAFAGDSAN